MPAANLVFLLACILWEDDQPLAPERRENPAPIRQAGEHRDYREVFIPMRDGVKLHATLCLPPVSNRTAMPRTPVIFTLTPYLAASYRSRAEYFASHGYGFASVDVRGRGDSAGVFEPYVHESDDGYDVVEWLAKQPFCDGHVGMWGGSYAGFDQWATARKFPPHLSSIAPAAAAHPGVDAPYYNNIGQPYAVQWLAGLDGKAHLPEDPGFWRGKFLSAYRQHVAFRSLDRFVGVSLPNFQRFLQHPTRDSYYDALTPSADQFKKIAIPVLTITGQYDDDEYGALTYYRDHLANAPPEAAARHYLVIGPWDHAGTRIPTDEVGGVKFGAAALLDLNELHRQWYDWTMKGGARPGFLKGHVAYYLLAPGNTGGNGEWKYAESLAALSDQPRSFYFDSKDGDANGVSHSGTLAETPPKGGADKYVYDPLDTRRGEKLEARGDDESEMIDQRYSLSIDEDGLVYQTAPLAEEKDLIGCPSVRLWLSLDTPDTDLEAYLYEIQPDGTNIRLWTDTVRLRYRESPRASKPVKPGEIVACDLAPGLFVSRRLLKGSRLRLVISSPNTILVEKNYNSGGVVAAQTAKDAHKSHIQIYHDHVHRSVLQFHLLEGENNVN